MKGQSFIQLLCNRWLTMMRDPVRVAREHKANKSFIGCSKKSEVIFADGVKKTVKKFNICVNEIEASVLFLNHNCHISSLDMTWVTAASLSVQIK